jgi:DNA transposition AAA+ family ATPase
MSGALKKLSTYLDVYAARSIYEMHDELCRKLRDGHGANVILIDEAQHLTNQTLEEFRCIHDETGVPIVFSGNATFQTRFNRAKGAVFAQLTSRVGMHLKIWESSEEDIRAYCQHHDIEGEKETLFLVRQAKASGGLRTLVKLLGIARSLTNLGEPIKIDHLKSATGMIMGASK